MPKNRWELLSNKVTDIWDMLPNNMKIIILGKYNSAQYNNRKYPTDNRKYTPNKSKTNKSNFQRKLTTDVHEILDTLYDNDMNQDTIIDAYNNINTTNNDNMSPDNSDTNLVNLTKSQNISPEYIRKVLSNYTPKNSFNTSKPPPNREITIGGKKYILVNTSSIYSVSSYHRTYKYSLIDRGANGGV